MCITNVQCVKMLASQISRLKVGGGGDKATARLARMQRQDDLMNGSLRRQLW
jgi:hypothetical protein